MILILVHKINTQHKKSKIKNQKSKIKNQKPKKTFISHSFLI
jgi:hypothetical protein